LISISIEKFDLKSKKKKKKKIFLPFFFFLNFFLKKKKKKKLNFVGFGKHWKKISQDQNQALQSNRKEIRIIPFFSPFFLFTIPE